MMMLAAKNLIQERMRLSISMRAVVFGVPLIMSAEEFASGLEQLHRRVNSHGSGGCRLHAGAAPR